MKIKDMDRIGFGSDGWLSRDSLKDHSDGAIFVKTVSDILLCAHIQGKGITPMISHDLVGNMLMCGDNLPTLPINNIVGWMPVVWEK